MKNGVVRWFRKRSAAKGTSGPPPAIISVLLFTASLIGNPVFSSKNTPALARRPSPAITGPLLASPGTATGLPSLILPAGRKRLRRRPANWDRALPSALHVIANESP